MAATGQPSTLPTLEQVARAAGVSRQTVSNALNAPERLSPDTLDRVLGVVDALGYRPNRSARSLRTRRSRLIGVRIEPASDGPDRVADRFLHALTDAATGLEQQVLLFTPPDPDDELSGYEALLRSTAVDAFVLTATHHDDERLAMLRRHGAPFVSFGRPWGEPTTGHPWVDVDGAAGTAAAAEHLVEMGHRRIAFLGWPEDSDVGQDRLFGWSRRLASYGLDTSLVAHGRDDVAAARRAVAPLLELADPPSALVCVSDTMAVGAYHELAARGLHPGRDVAVVGFDDSVAAPLLIPPLSSVRQPVEDVAREIVRLLADVMSGRAHPPQGVLLPPRLVVRDSSSVPFPSR